jgi:lysophospholipase L1-like esterase
MGALGAALCALVLAGLTLAVRDAPVSGAGEAPIWHKPLRNTALMVVGDSISQGSAGDFTWRYWLYKQLVGSGARPDMVGPRHDLYDNVTEQLGNLDYADPAFDTDHDAIWGRLLASAATTITTEVVAAKPNCLLVLLGINDLLGTATPASVALDLELLVENARVGSPNLKIVLGRLLPSSKALADPQFAARVADYNGRLNKMAAELSTPVSPIVVADTDRGIDVATDLYDGTHPNARGEYKIAAAFADALADRFGIGRPFPPPLPDLAVGPHTPPVLTGEANDRSAQLSWTRSPGATSYWLFQRAGDGEFTRILSLPANQRQYTTPRLASGVTYEFELQPAKGSNDGAMSNVIRVTPS